MLSGGPEIVVIKKGGEGAYLAQGDKRFSTPVFPVDKLIDPTGAGDSFAGGFMGYLAQTETPDFIEAIVYGSAMASFCVEGFGLDALLNADVNLLKQRVESINQSMLEKS